MLAYLVMIIIMDCKLPKALTFFFFGNVAIFLYLFSDFYRNAYLKPQRPKQFSMPCMSNQLVDENKNEADEDARWMEEKCKSA